ncbi:kelch repeat protein [Cystoisospora suis]|uniref:Kelch repeat protein n=1 Tax=Cystoisospora suis TaxID=483139 RepID=A0A2C6KLV4_9APIC|nr:kelch repeat protein [Cystoisospora suis]
MLSSVFGGEGAGGSERRARCPSPELEEHEGGESDNDGTTSSRQNRPSSLSENPSSPTSTQGSPGDSSSLQGTSPLPTSKPPQDGSESHLATRASAHSEVLAAQTSQSGKSSTTGGGVQPEDTGSACLSSLQHPPEKAHTSGRLGSSGITSICDPSLPLCDSTSNTDALSSSSSSSSAIQEEENNNLPREGGGKSSFPVSCYSFTSSTTTATPARHSFLPYLSSGSGSSSTSFGANMRQQTVISQQGTATTTTAATVEENSAHDTTTITTSTTTTTFSSRRWNSLGALLSSSSSSSSSLNSPSSSPPQSDGHVMNHPDDKRPPYSWIHPEISKSPGPRAAHSCDVIGTKLFLFGGWNGKCALGDLYVFDTQKLRWYHIKQDPETCGRPPKARNNHATATVGDKIFIHGGHDGTQWLSDLHILDTTPAHAGKYTGLVWTSPQFTGWKPCPRACHSLTRVNEKLYLYGGFDGHECFQDLDILDLETMAWIRPAISGKKPKARNAHTMTAVGTKLVLCGGHSGKTHITDVHVFDTATLSWSEPEIRGFPPPALRGHTANLIGHKIFLFGGFDGKSRTNEVYILDTRTRSWLLVPDVSSPSSSSSSSSPFSYSQSGESSAITSSRLATKRTSETAQEGDEDGHSRGSMCGGARGGGMTSLRTSTTGASTSCSSTHRRVISPPPPARQSHSAALVGNRKVFVFGGFDGFRWLNDLYILDTSHFEEDVLHESTVRQFVENMRTLVNSPDFSDIVLVVEGRDICAHKCILAANCEFFRQMFAGNMMESRQSHITIPGWSYDAYIAMIEFLYTGKLSDTRTHVACEVGRHRCRG